MSRKRVGGLHAALVASLRVPGPMRDAAVAELDRLVLDAAGDRTSVGMALGVSDRQVRRLLGLYRATEPAL